jgi:cytochrome c biogenesis protein CcmG, thiol:disulfide interchange protein DsbE
MVTERAVLLSVRGVLCLMSLLAAVACSTAPNDRVGPGPVKVASVEPGCPSASGQPLSGVPPMVLPCLAHPARSVQLSVDSGRPQVVNVWASWCGPCRAELPVLQTAHEKAGRRVLFVGVDVRDSPSSALKFLAAHGATYPQVFDKRGQFPRAMRFAGVPDTLVLDAHGKVVDRITGVLTEKRLARDLAEALRRR